MVLSNGTSDFLIIFCKSEGSISIPISETCSLFTKCKKPICRNESN